MATPVKSEPKVFQVDQLDSVLDGNELAGSSADIFVAVRGEIVPVRGVRIERTLRVSEDEDGDDYDRIVLLTDGE